MEKRFQVFISSTFKDLIDERQAVLKAVLELNHMPAGMELFPASDETAWQLIKDIIDASDYYVLIIGGRYGSLDDRGIGYTEKEYDYAQSLGKPVISLLHKNPDNLPRGKTEVDEAAWKKLTEFREKVESNHTCVYWEEVSELKVQVILGLTSSTKRNPGIGWVRADKVPDEDTMSEILKLRKNISELTDQLESEKVAPPKEAEGLAQGDDEIEFNYTFDAEIPDEKADFGYRDARYKATISVSWNEIWKSIAPKLINECTESLLISSFKSYLTSTARKSLGNLEELNGASFSSFVFPGVDIETCLVQFRALGLMRESIKNRSVKDTKTYWTLTSYGDHLMVNLRAIRKEPIEKKELKSHVEKNE